MLSLGVNKLWSKKGDANDYSALGVRAPLVADFEQEYYRKSGGSTSLTTMMTHTATTNATMTDGYGPELVANGGFGADTNWTLGTGWSISGGIAVKTSGTASFLRQDISLVEGKVYAVEWEMVSRTAGEVGPELAGTNMSGLTQVQKYKQFIKAGSQTTGLRFYANSSFVGSIDNVSVREMPVIKWRPHNLLTYSEDFDNAAWIFSTGTRTANYALAPDGTLTADRIQLPASAGTYVAQTSPVIEGLSYTVSFWVKATSGTSFFDIYVAGASTVQKGTQTATNEWQLFTFTFTASLTNISVGINNGNDSYASDILVWGAHLYRSDLGGMVDNPETGDSYVRTAVRPIGPELITNGTFDSNISGWTDTSESGGSVAWNANGIALTTGVDGNQEGRATQIITTQIGSSYQITATRSGAPSRIDIDNAGSFGANIYFSSVATTSINHFFTATSTTTYINLRNLTGYNATAYIDNISVKKADVNPAIPRYMPRVGHHIYNGYEWVNEGLLHESEARTNLVPNSAVDASWNTTNVSVIYNDALSPDGNQNATKITETTVTSNFYTASSNASFTAGQVYTSSAIVKAGTRTFVQLLGTSSAFGQEVYANFDLSDGTIGSQGSGVSQATIEPLGNGWYRCSITGAATITISAIAAFVLLVPSKTAARAQTYTGSTSNYLYAYSAQTEIGSTPSSYIPTNGAAVTRAVESLTIPAANLPYPAPVYTGPELVTNGTFDTDSGWLKSNDVTISGGAANIVSTGTYQYVAQTNVLEVDKIYQVTYDIVSPSTGLLKASTSFDGVANIFSSVGSHSFVGKAKITTLYIERDSICNILIDNISVREINPLSVSIQMAGKYDAVNADDLVMFARWYKDTDNRIQMYRQDSNWTFYQRAFAVTDTASIASTSGYGINYSFDIAQRNGSTFVNGAADGIAATTNTTPIALPDLSTTPLSLGYDYMGTISQFRMWDKDIGDTGIVDATAPSLEPTLSLSFDETASSYTNTNWSE